VCLLVLLSQPDNPSAPRSTCPLLCTILRRRRGCATCLSVATFTFAIILLLHSATRCDTSRARECLVDTALATGLVRVGAVPVRIVSDHTCGTLCHSRSAKAVLGRGPLVLGTVLFDSAVLRGLVLLTARAAGRVAALLALDVRVRSVPTEGNRVSARSPFTSNQKTLTSRQSRAQRKRACRVCRPS
jgi:hypothetical protein